MNEELINYTNDQIKPSDFTKVIPMDSIKQRVEWEDWAGAVMTYLAKNGDTWRLIDKEKLHKDIGSHLPNLDFLDEILILFTSPIAAATFSPNWMEVYCKRVNEIVAKEIYNHRLINLKPNRI